MYAHSPILVHHVHSYVFWHSSVMSAMPSSDPIMDTLARGRTTNEKVKKNHAIVEARVLLQNVTSNLCVLPSVILRVLTLSPSLVQKRPSCTAPHSRPGGCDFPAHYQAIVLLSSRTSPSQNFWDVSSDTASTVSSCAVEVSTHLDILRARWAEDSCKCLVVEEQRLVDERVEGGMARS